MAAAGRIVIAYDGSVPSRHAVRSAGELLGGRSALVLVVWKQGLAFELMSLPTVRGLPPAKLDIAATLATERALYEQAEELARQGAGLARDAGLQAEGLVVADDLDVPIQDTITRVARELDAASIVVGSHHHGRDDELLPGTVTRGVLRRARMPVLVVRPPDDG
jgi:nucleotide-binding universal stress UspA family protein